MPAENDHGAANRKVALINFYNPKALGVRFVEKALSDAGFEVTVLHIGGYRGVRAGKPNEEKIREFLDLTEGELLWIGFSVVSSFFLKIAEEVSDLVRRHTRAPLVWGGVFATLLPERCLAHCDYVIRGEGEAASVDFSKRLAAGSDVRDMPNLVHRQEGETTINPVRPLETDLSSIGIAELGLPNKYFLDDNNGDLYHADPCVSSYSYETSASRGCPFACSFCSTANIRRLYANTPRYMRFRPAGDVIDEIKRAKERMNKVTLIRFWDEIFSTDPLWIDEFAARYKAEIGLPFEIWTHPLRTDGTVLRKLRGAGLRLIVMGIQSGSPEVRKKVFRRSESQEQIIAAAQTMADCRIPYVTYDIILGHPLETIDQLKESYDLCSRLPGRFSLQLHGLSFLPGTDIVEEVIKRGLYTREELEELMYMPMDRQYSFWNEAKNADPEMEFWYNLIFLTQFSFLRGVARRLAKKPAEGKSKKKAARYYRISRVFSRLRHVRQKGINVIRERRK